MKEVNSGKGELMSEDENTEMYNRWMRSLKEVQDDDQIDKKRMDQLDRGMGQLIDKLYGVVLNEWGDEGGGKNGLEWYGNCSGFWPNQKRKKGAY